MIEPAFLVAAFLGGVAALIVRLPPLVGFLAAGYVLNAMGYAQTPLLGAIADIGVTLLLFTIGLKLDIRTLLRGAVWGGASVHLLASTVIMIGVLSLAKLAGLRLMQDETLTTMAFLGFALSFSSTVFVIKVLDKRSEAQTAYGRLAIGVLIMQDIFAVVFITASTGELPSPWALLLLGLIPAAPWLQRLLDAMGHGEMQMLFGMMLALVLGYGLFSAVGIKGDLGALIIGLLLAPHPAAQNLARTLFNIKELLLVGFFLNIGLIAMPTLNMLLIALVLVAALPLKAILYQLIFMLFHLRHRTSILASLSLANFSEFGLIVEVIAVSNGWLSDEWLVILSLAVAISFMFSAILNGYSEALYRYLSEHLPRIPKADLDPSDRPIELGDAQAVVLGMGRIGRSAYQRLQKHYGLNVLGIDSNPNSVKKLGEKGYNIMEGDAVDSDFWDKLMVSPSIKLVVLAMPHHAGNLFALEQLQDRDEFEGHITAIVEYPDEIKPIQELGANAVYHIYDEAGRSLADSAAREAGMISHLDQLG